ncbi:hypothetical protein BACPEC_00621 [[Bacteroides] pectinophilus ATCC 43243]|uniref:Uncharacterized protein n=1 Tax=[Bacteroides] pectinophilus ATCC 43243 TaxID=483218 RepID=B7APL6_9FIRM|nr:hypothetical protein BACPEC_00621 [[Bacteroides] pectinophilus ATCC 43243]
MSYLPLFKLLHYKMSESKAPALMPAACSVPRTPAIPASLQLNIAFIYYLFHQKNRQIIRLPVNSIQNEY